MSHLIFVRAGWLRLTSQSITVFLNCLLRHKSLTILGKVAEVDSGGNTYFSEGGGWNPNKILTPFHQNVNQVITSGPAFS